MLVSNILHSYWSSLQLLIWKLRKCKVCTTCDISDETAWSHWLSLTFCGLFIATSLQITSYVDRRPPPKVPKVIYKSFSKCTSEAAEWKEIKPFWIQVTECRVTDITRPNTEGSGHTVKGKSSLWVSHTSSMWMWHFAEGNRAHCAIPSPSRLF